MSDEPGPERFQKVSNVSRETLERLKIYAGILEKWNPRINLVSKPSLADLWTRHMLDSAQIWGHRSTDTGIWADFGSGGGFPGLVIAALAHAEAPEIKVKLIDSDVRKGVFLRTAASAMGLDVEVITSRVDTLPSLGASTVSARALAPLAALFEMAERHLAPGGTALFLKGESYQSELTEAGKTWEYKAETVPSITDSNAVLVKIGEFSRV
jgi:16S rRNA (guanine527-N7)-methyltransferase